MSFNKTALVIEGGAMRGIYSAGILDAFIEKSFNPFQLVVGVSAGASNGCAYLAGQKGRNYKVFIDYSTRGPFISWWKFLKGGHLIDLDWLWEISIKEIPIDAVRMKASDSKMLIGITDANSGSVFFIEPDEIHLADILKASSAVPYLYRNILKVEDRECTDGGIAAPIPVQKAIDEGSDRVLVLRSRPASFRMKERNIPFWVKRKLSTHPGVIEAMQNRPSVYNDSLELIRNPPKGIQITEVCPPEDYSVSRLTTDICLLDREYDRACLHGYKIMDQWA